MSALSTDSLPIIFVASLVAFFLAVEAGHYLGSRIEEGKNVATLEAAVLGLLALMIGFTFSMALNRFEARRDALMTEANAIGTAALRARLLPRPLRRRELEALQGLRAYSRRLRRARAELAGGRSSLAPLARNP